MNTKTHFCLLTVAVALVLTGCGKNIDGTYTAESVMGTSTYVFHNGSLVVNGTNQFKYHVDGDQIILETGGNNGNQVLQILPDGSIQLALGAKLVKNGAAAKAAQSTSLSPKEISKQETEADAVLSDLRSLSAAIDQWSTDHGKKSGVQPTAQDLLKLDPQLNEIFVNGEFVDHLRNPIHIPAAGKPLTVSQKTYDALSQVADANYWGPFAPATK